MLGDMPLLSLVSSISLLLKGVSEVMSIIDLNLLSSEIKKTSHAATMLTVTFRFSQVEYLIKLVNRFI